MKKILTGMVALSALAAAAPASAQYQNSYPQNAYPQNGYGQGNGAYANGNLSARIGQLQARIDAGVRSGAISRQEAASLRQQLRQLVQLERRYAVNGVSGQERADLQQRIRYVRQQLRSAEGGAQARWNDDEDYNQGRYGQRAEDRNRNGVDDRYERSGGYDDRYEDDRYEDDRGYRQPSAGGVGGVLGSVLGGGGLGSVLGGVMGGGGLGGLGGLADILRVGQRATGGLFAVPSQYGSQYRDGNGVQYRTDGRQIYQLDASNQTVLRVLPMSR
jgi:hypothetical protein